jgi:hypothetical protein
MLGSSAQARPHLIMLVPWVAVITAEPDPPKQARVTLGKTRMRESCTSQSRERKTTRLPVPDLVKSDMPSVQPLKSFYTAMIGCSLHRAYVIEMMMLCQLNT